MFDLRYSSCGYYHTGLIRKDKRLFLFGNNDDNQLAHSHVTPFSGPIEVSTPKHVVAVACGYQHTAVLTEDGEVYTCGTNLIFDDFLWNEIFSSY